MLTGYGPFTYERNGPLGDVSKITDDALRARAEPTTAAAASAAAR